MNIDHYPEVSALLDGAARGRPWLGALAMIGPIGAFFILREHWNHVAGFWPYLLLLSCPLIHMFHGHRGHGSHRRSE